MRNVSVYSYIGSLDRSGFYWLLGLQDYVRRIANRALCVSIIIMPLRI